MPKVFLAILLLCSLSLAIGCGSKGTRVEHVTGTVTFNGEPIEDARIAFVSAMPDGENEGAFGRSDARGVYLLTSWGGEPDRGAMAGDYIVTVQKAEITELMPADETRSTYVETTAIRNLLPEIYLNRETSPLRVTVNRGRNVINLELTNTQ